MKKSDSKGRQGAPKGRECLFVKKNESANVIRGKGPGGKAEQEKREALGGQVH